MHTVTVILKGQVQHPVMQFKSDGMAHEAKARILAAVGQVEVKDDYGRCVSVARPLVDAIVVEDVERAIEAAKAQQALLMRAQSGLVGAGMLNGNGQIGGFRQ